MPGQQEVQIKCEFSDGVMLFLRRFLVSEVAVITGDVGEAVEGVGAAGAGGHLRSPAHRAWHHLSGELWVDVLRVSWTFLEEGGGGGGGGGWGGEGGGGGGRERRAGTRLC